jgi:hypothetical protein
MAPVLTTHRPLPVRDLRRIFGGAALAVLVVLFVALLALVEAPTTVDRVTIQNRSPNQVEVGIRGRHDDAVLWLAAVAPGSTAVVEDVLDPGGDWVVRAENAGRRVDKRRVARDDLERQAWRIVIPASRGEPSAGT